MSSCLVGKWSKSIKFYTKYLSWYILYWKLVYTEFNSVKDDDYSPFPFLVLTSIEDRTLVYTTFNFLS